MYLLIHALIPVGDTTVAIILDKFTLSFFDHIEFID